MQSPEFPDLLWMPPASFSPGRPYGPPRLLVVHYTAGSEGPASAEDGAAYDQVRTDGTSAHSYVDQNSVVQCVATWDRAHTALDHGNWYGIHLELCGTIQSRAGWLDAASRATIRLAADFARRCMDKWGIPAVKLSPSQVRAGAAGMCGHGDITYAWPEDGGNHTDPGTAFPWDVLLADITGEPDEEGDTEMVLGKSAATDTILAGNGTFHWRPRSEVQWRAAGPERTFETDEALLAAVGPVDAEELAANITALGTAVQDLTTTVDVLSAGGVDTDALADLVVARLQPGLLARLAAAEQAAADSLAGGPQ
jgi:hypothetical protein